MLSQKNSYNEVLDFINKFKASNPVEIEKNFLYGNCYWFAKILELRFNGVIIYYPVENHFVTRIENIEYDISGIVDYKDSRGYNWNNYIRYDKLDYYRVVINCIEKRD